MDAATIAATLTGAIGANDNEATVSQYLSTGYPELDFALSSKWDGGAAVGRLIEIAGPASSGKTALATALMADAQKKGGIAGFSDHERSFSLQLAPRLGLDPTPGRFIYKKPRTFEDSLELLTKAVLLIRNNKLIDKDAPIAWVFDSLASMVPNSAAYDSKTGKDKEYGDRNMNDNTALARATSAHGPSLASFCEEYNVCAIFLNQIRMKLGVMYGDPRTTPGGEAFKFYFSQRVMLGSSHIKKDKDILGAQVSAIVNKNKVSRPFLPATWRFEFQPDGTGKFAFYRSLIDFLVKEKMIKTAGAYVEWEGSKYYAGPLAEKLEKEGAWDKLKAMLPAAFAPEEIIFEEGTAAA